ncbi:hypothetical protein KP509_08G007100 [Ceratopteris richardii]|uniref:NB-ARC domain-containing protein n=1 Tax=Ceratopteris richardii TaxID=49495 RepID=A0A8T2U4E0_CERRI|nr:hypothetical protein KP509_08G007100 [Ceratopteris richardii]
MGGIGKTTLAMSIYNKIHGRFEGSSFCLNIRAELQTKGASGLVALQKRILNNLLYQHNDDDVKIDNELHGKGVLSNKLKGINALVVLDDVDEIKHLGALYEPLQASLGPKSVVIITSRDYKILKSAQPKSIFPMKGLDEKMSKRLFYWHAFMKPHPPKDLEEVSDKVTEACKGHPLSLKVVGSHLYHNTDESFWEESLHYLLEHEGIVDALKISYNGLSDNVKEVFLDICCFLINEREDHACMVLVAIYGRGRTYLTALKERCLITIIADEDIKEVGRIGMHDLLRDMGRRIVCHRTRRDRAWDEDTANDIFQNVELRSKLCILSVWSHIPFPEESVDSKFLPELRILVVNKEYKRTKIDQRSFIRTISLGVLIVLR